MEPVIESLARAYKTADFEFVAFVLAYRDPKVEIKELIPYDTYNARRKQNSTRYLFVLIGLDGDDVDWYDKLDTLYLSYINKRTLVEPNAVAASRRMLRSMIWDNDEMRKKGIRPRPTIREVEKTLEEREDG